MRGFGEGTQRAVAEPTIHPTVPAAAAPTAQAGDNSVKKRRHAWSVQCVCRIM